MENDFTDSRNYYDIFMNDEENIHATNVVDAIKKASGHVLCGLARGWCSLIYDPIGDGVEEYRNSRDHDDETIDSAARTTVGVVKGMGRGFVNSFYKPAKGFVKAFSVLSSWFNREDE